MLCYKDKSWCTEQHCQNKECTVNITDKVHKDAIAWWNKGEELKDYTEPPFSVQPMKDTESCIGYIGKKHWRF